MPTPPHHNPNQEHPQHEQPTRWRITAASATQSESQYYESYNTMIAALYDLALEQMTTALCDLALQQMTTKASPQPNRITGIDLHRWDDQQQRWIKCRWKLTEPLITVEYNP